MDAAELFDARMRDNRSDALNPFLFGVAIRPPLISHCVVCENLFTELLKLVKR
jgi:hypothetical protein